jgi:adenylyltransferase/sulfurtransferase
LIDYEGFCGYGSGGGDEIGARDLHRRLASGDPILLIDVREEHEWAVSRLPGAEHLPLARLRGELSRLPRDRDIVLYCRGGSRSGNAVAMLHNAGLVRAKNLSGGLLAWRSEIDPAMPVV